MKYVVAVLVAVLFSFAVANTALAQTVDERIAEALQYGLGYCRFGNQESMGELELKSMQFDYLKWTGSFCLYGAVGQEPELFYLYSENTNSALIKVGGMEGFNSRTDVLYGFTITGKEVNTLKLPAGVNKVVIGGSERIITLAVPGR